MKNERPKSGFKRKAIPLRVKLASALIAFGMVPDMTEFDHDPALGLRPLNDAGDDTIPPQLDPRFIVPRSTEAHKAKTHGNKTDPLSGDLAKIRKTKRLEAKRWPMIKTASAETLEKWARPWPKRKFQNRKRKPK